MTLLFSVACATAALAETDWNPREPFLKALVKGVPSMLKSQDPATGRFGSQPWICTDQNVLFPLAAAWAIQDPANPYYHDPKVLNAIMAGGDALIADQDKHGAWIFRKKDNSTWGQTLMPWTYSRWIRAYQLIKDAMPAERRQHWEKGLLLGFTNISKSCLGSIKNIPTHHAMALYCAGVCFDREDWKKQAREFMARVAREQSPAGWWSEHSGPVVAYNFVYVEAFGVYYSMSHDPAVLEVLKRSALFHGTFIYPNGTMVETVDERNPYESGTAHGNVGFSFTPVEGNVGFSFTPEGRGFLQHQFQLRKWSITADEAASHLIHGERGPLAPIAADSDERLNVIGNNDAMVLRHKPWFICLSAFTCGLSNARWIQDRQNFVSVYQDRVGLIVGGGNTNFQPFWSNFTVGKTTHLPPNPGDENPDFKLKGDLIYMPSAAQLHSDKVAPNLELTYGPENCRVTVRPLDDNRLTLACEATGPAAQPVEGHITFLPHLSLEIKTASGKSAKLGDELIEWSAADMGAWFDLGPVRVTVPPGTKLVWPKKRHNPYKKDGSSTLREARLVLCLPFSSTVTKQEVTLEITR